MFKIRIAELNILIDNKYSYIEKMCENYIVSDNKTDFSVKVTEEEILKEDNNLNYDNGYLESLAIYRKIAEKIIDFDGFLMHGAVVEAENIGIAFLAKSGVGKTTHIKLWNNLLGDKLNIINGDKPIIRILNNNIYAYGTPWAGKENLNTNKKTELKKICFIKRAEKNNCFEADKNTVIKGLLSQVYIPENKGKAFKLFELLDKLVNTLSFYNLCCNKEIDAAITAYNKLML